jgi:tetratricopeptide (TPR) repeat protein
MAQILQHPVQASKLGYKRVRRRCKADDPNQLDLFSAPAAQILDFGAGLSPFEQALLWDERGDKAAAADLYAEAIEKEDCQADAYCNLGIIETQRGNTARAFDCFTTALKHNARHAEAHYNLGNLYFDQNDFRLAEFHFGIAVEVEPDFANGYFNLALVLAINNEPAKALHALRQYQEHVSPEEARAAADLLDSIKDSLAAAKITRISGLR